MDVEIYSKTNCIFCDKAKFRLAEENPKIHMLDKDYTREDFFKKFPRRKNLSLKSSLTEQSIGGYHELEKWLEINSFSEEDF